MRFILVKTADITPELFEKHPAWAEYYEPDDIEDMVKDGFDRKEIITALKATGYSDDYIFPILNDINLYHYNFIYYKATFRFPNNTSLPGYLFLNAAKQVVSITVFVNYKQYVLNLGYPDLTKNNEKELCQILKLSSIWPIQILSKLKGVTKVDSTLTHNLNK